MPEMDGVETMLKIRELGEKYKNLIIIALTANAVKDAREMFFEKGFSDFISKPIEVSELTEILRRHLPPEKQKTINSDVKKSLYAEKDELRRKAAVTFVKENMNTISEINDSLDLCDFKTAHRIAHTLKSSAGFLGKKSLQQMAAELEASLQSEPPAFTHVQVSSLEKELNIALDEFMPLYEAAASAKSEVVEIDSAKLAELVAELKPLLKKSDSDALRIAEELQGIAGMAELIEKIEDYEFEEALELLEAFDIPEAPAQTEPGWLEKLGGIAEINVKIGLSRVSNMEALYRETTELFCKNLGSEREKLSLAIDKADLQSLAINVHAMKSALSTVGAMEISGMAAKLEDAAKASNLEFCSGNFPAFREALDRLYQQLSAVFPSEKTAPAKRAGDKAFLAECVEKAYTAADDYDSDAALDALKGVLNCDFGNEINALLEKVSEALGSFNPSEAAEILNELKKLM
jgi:HPt (histidine-containing phosphotransfer) domain-containing protein